MEHRTAEELGAALAGIRESPAAQGTVELIVRRPAVDEREVLETGLLDLDEGLVGDSWRPRGNRHTPDGSANLEAQLTLMNARAAEAVAGARDRWPLAGDQLYVDLDLSTENLPTGTRLTIGDAELEVTAAPHTGCAQFKERFGVEALRLTATPDGRFLRLRGINTRVVQGGQIRPGHRVEVVRP